MDNADRVHALLVGIDHYLSSPTDASDDPGYRSLRGCVADARRVARLLIEDCGVPSERVTLLTAPHPPAAAGADLPTYGRLVGALRDLLAQADPGDAVWIHYSGHGGRTPTLYPELKGGRAFDEALVPTDIADAESQYLRDIELGFLLEQLVRHGLFVTLVLDCCYAGGLLRDASSATPALPEAEPRSNQVKDWLRLRPSAVAPPEELAASWRRFGVPWSAHGSCGYVLLAACREHEQAWEYAVAPTQHGGALTHALLETVRQDGTGLTYRGLFERIHGRVRTRFEGFQTPRLEGESNRRLFGGDSTLSLRGITVLAVEPERVLLATGRAQGVAAGDLFVLQPLVEADGPADDVAPAVAELIDVGGAESWAGWIRRGRQPVLPGDRAMPLSFIASRQGVILDDSLGPFAERLRALDNPFLAWERVSPATFRAAACAEEVLVVTAGDGRPLPHPVPRLELVHTEPLVAAQLLERLARYRTVEQLAHRAPKSPLENGLAVRLGQLPPTFRPRIDELVPQTDLGRRASVPFATWLTLTIENRARQPLEIAVLDLDPTWCVTQLYPSRDRSLVVGPGDRIRLPLCTRPPAGTHQLKVFATLDAVRWYWLELPPGRLPSPPRDRPRTPTEEWLSSLLRPGLGSTSMRTGRADAEWTVQDLTIHTEISKPPA